MRITEERVFNRANALPASWFLGQTRTSLVVKHPVNAAHPNGQQQKQEAAEGDGQDLDGCQGNLCVKKKEARAAESVASTTKTGCNRLRYKKNPVFVLFFYLVLFQVLQRVWPCLSRRSKECHVLMEEEYRDPTQRGTLTGADEKRMTVHLLLETVSLA